MRDYKYSNPKLSRKFLFGRKFPKNGPTCLFVSYYSIFLRITLMEPFGKITACPKMSQNYTKWFNLSVTTFDYGSIFSQDLLIRFVSFFAWSWEAISTQNWRRQVFWENSSLPENGPKWSKFPWFVGLSNTATLFLGIGSLAFSDILYEVVGT